jgi:hypothetical protein
MKYLRATVDGDTNINGHELLNIDRIVGEMINIDSGITYYDDYVYINKGKPGHNTYIINEVGYEVHPNIGVVYIFDKNNNISISDIINTHRNKRFLLNNKQQLPTTSGIIPTTQYVCVTSETEICLINYVKNAQIKHFDIKSEYNFTWYIYTDLGIINNSSWYIPFINGKNVSQSVQLLSLSTIVLDYDTCFNLPNGHCSPNLPLIEDYSLYKSGYIYNKPIYLNCMYGIRHEIASHFTKIPEFNREISNLVSDPIYWIKWENVKPRALIKCHIPWEDQVKNASLKYYNDYNDEDNNMNPRDNAINENYVCFITGIPIYEDCYVFDIYEQYVIEDINVDDLDNAIALGAKLYIEKDFVPVKNKYELRGRSKKVKKNVKTNIVDKKVGLDISGTPNENEDINKLIVEVMPKRKGQKKSDKYTKIVRIKQHDEPIHILISPYAMHVKLFGDISLYQYFKNTTMSKIIMYRTFCPRLCIDVINTLPGNVLYHDILNALNHGFSINTNREESGHGLSTIVNDKQILFRSSFRTSEIIGNDIQPNICLIY